MQAVAAFALYLSPSLYFTFFLIVVMGIAMPPRVFVGYTYAMECLPKKNTPVASSIIMGMDGMVLLWSSLYFMFIDNNWKTLYGIVLIVTFATFIIAGSFPESPRFLLSKGRYAETRKVISKMAETNGLEKFNTREGEPTANVEGELQYLCLFEEEVQENKKHQ